MVKIKIYALAAAITLLLVLSGFSLNWYISNEKERDIEQKFLDLQTSIAESQLELTYLTEFIKNGCDLLEETREMTSTNLFEINRKLERYKDYLIAEPEFRRLKIEQTIIYVKLWMLALKMKEECQGNLSTILYFFDVHSLESQQQGYVLNSITEEYGNNIFIVPLDYEFDVGIIKIISKQFNVTGTPTIIINEKIKLEGINSKEKILSHIH